MLTIESVSTSLLIPYAQNARTHSDKQIAQIARSIREFGFTVPILIDEANTVMAGHGRLLAAKQLGMQEVPVIRHEHMTEVQKKSYILADNRLAEKAGWNRDSLKLELAALLELDVNIDLTVTGFETPELDLLFNEASSASKADPVDSIADEDAVPKQVRSGDLWQLGNHRLYCGDSLKSKSFDILMEGKLADVVFTDPPYNVPVDGHVCGTGKIRHKEFAQASGEMTPEEFTGFLSKSFDLLMRHSKDGSIHYVCMDWRHMLEMMTAGKIYDELKNICVWNKQLGGMGSFYRSQHELVFVFKHGKASHINNIELGKHGRYRTNVWDYPGVHANNNHRDDLKLHPTVKPVQMIADAIIDSSKQGGIVLDCFAGSGSTLLAAERSKRKAYVIEYETHYCDVILYRFGKMTGIKPSLISGGANV